jgi:hypothetical protein
MGRQGDGDFMDQVNPGGDGRRCNGSGAVETADEFIVHPAMPGRAVERLASGANRQSVQTFRPLGEGIQGFGPQILPPDDNQGANRESLALAGRPDIDAAIVLALRSTVIAKSSFPMHGYLAPDQSRNSTVNPPGER